MKNESVRVSKLLTSLYEGQPWIDVNIRQTLESLTAEKAARKIRSDVNSVWEISNHMVSWRNAVLKRLNGEGFPSPPNNFFEPIDDTSESAWKQTLQQFEETEREWISNLENLDEKDLDDLPFESSSWTRYELIHAIIQHDAYHLGQIKLLLRILQE